MDNQIKSRERVASYGEVFTAQREVNSMCNLVADMCKNYSATFLEPACGNGNFLAEILSRKLSAITHTPDYERKSLIALSSLYGIDILPDNIQACKLRLRELWEAAYSHSQTAIYQAARILDYNIVCADSLKPENITLQEWTFPEGSIIPESKAFKLSEEVNGQYEIPFDE